MSIDSKSTSTELASRNEEAFKFLDHLQQDFDSAAALLNSDKTSPFARRTYVRTAGAFVEGTISYFQDYLESRNKAEPFLGRDELVILEGHALYLDSQGEIRKRSVDYPLRQMILFILPLIPRASYCKWRVQIFKNCVSWQNFCRFLIVTNAVIHPTCSEHLLVSDLDIEHVHSGIDWFMFQTRYALLLPIVMGYLVGHKLLKFYENTEVPIPDDVVQTAKQFAEMQDPYGKMVAHLVRLADRAGISKDELTNALDSAR